MTYFNTGSWGKGILGTNPLWDINSAGGNAWLSGADDFRIDFLENNPEAAFAEFSKLLGGNRFFQNWLRNNYDRIYQSYAAETAKDKTLKWTDFLVQNAQNFANDADREFFGPAARGERAGSQRMRWIY